MAGTNDARVGHVCRAWTRAMRLGVIVTIRLSRPGNLARAVRCWRHAGSTSSLLLTGGARARHMHVCVCVRACVRACACARAHTYLNSRYTYLRCAHTYRSSDVGRHLLSALRDEVEPVITAHVHSLRYPAGRACVGFGLAFRLALLIFIRFSSDAPVRRESSRSRSSSGRSGLPCGSRRQVHRHTAHGGC